MFEAVLVDSCPISFNPSCIVLNPVTELGLCQTISDETELLEYLKHYDFNKDKSNKNKIKFVDIYETEVERFLKAIRQLDS